MNLITNRITAERITDRIVMTVESRTWECLQPLGLVTRLLVQWVKSDTAAAAPKYRRRPGYGHFVRLCQHTTRHVDPKRSTAP